MLILQASPLKANILHEPRATFGNIRDSLRLIHRSQSTCTFFRAFAIGFFQHLLTGIVAELVQSLFLPETELLRPLAYGISSALLCEPHLIFTCAIVSADSVPFRSLLRTPGQNRWKHLAIPAFLHGLSLSLMELLCRFIKPDLTIHLKSMERRHAIGAWAALALPMAIIVFAFRLMILLPTYITLTLAEVKFLPADTQTIAFSSTKGRLRVWELVGDQKPLASLETSRNSLEPSRSAISCQLIMLHLKKCFIQLVSELIYLLPIFVASQIGLFG